MKLYIFVNNQQIGPMTIEQLRFYNVNSDTQVRDESCPDWKSLMYYPELMEVYGPNARGNVQCCPQPVRPATPAPVYPKKNDNSWVIWLVAVVVGLPILGGILYFLFILLMVILSAMS